MTLNVEPSEQCVHTVSDDAVQAADTPYPTLHVEQVSQALWSSTSLYVTLSSQLTQTVSLDFVHVDIDPELTAQVEHV